MRGIGLAKLRTKSLRETAKDIGISAMYLSEIERGFKLPSMKMRKRIEEYYGMEFDDFWRYVEKRKLEIKIKLMQGRLKDLNLLDELEKKDAQDTDRT